MCVVFVVFVSVFESDTIYAFCFSSQDSSGADLCLLLVEAFNTSDAPTSGKNINRIANLYQMVQADIPERNRFMVSALQWSKNQNPDVKTGSPELHERLARILWDGKI